MWSWFCLACQGYEYVIVVLFVLQRVMILVNHCVLFYPQILILKFSIQIEDIWKIRCILFCYFVKKVKLAITWQSNISTMSLLGNFMRHIKTWKIISIIYINIVKFSLKKFISSPSNIFIIVRLKKKSTSFCLYNISCHLNTVMEQ